MNVRACHIGFLGLLSLATACSSSKSKDTDSEDEDGTGGVAGSSTEPSEGAASVCSEATFPAALTTSIQTLLAEYPDIPGAIVSVYHPSIGMTVAAFGKSHVANGTPMSVNGIVDIGSVHKLFKWVVLEKLAEGGQLTFTDAINDHVSTPVISGGTIQALTNHSTGMVDIGSNMFNDVLARNTSGGLPHEYTYDEMMAFLAAEDTAPFANGFHTDFPRGSGYNYSSYGPVVGAEIAKAITGKEIQVLQKELILDPLELHRTTHIGFDPDPENRIQGYGDKNHNDPAGVWGFLSNDILKAVSSANRGALFSTACNMVQFARAISEPELGFVSAATIESRTSSYNNLAEQIYVGRGVMKYKGFYDADFWVHAGDGMHAHSSVVGYSPSKKISIAIHTNLSPAFITDDFGFHFEVIDAIANNIE